MSQEKSGAEAGSQAYKILQNDRVGRYMVASRELQAGEEILTEMPFIVGPKAFTYPLCLSCYTPWPPVPDDKPLCSKCGWPVCGTECENQPQHKDYECPVFVQANEKFNVDAAIEAVSENGVPQLECITPLRVLLESEKNKERWDKEIKIMEPHNKIRSQKSHWKSDQVNVVEYIRRQLKLDRFSEEAIQTVCGILEINTFEIRTIKGFPARALYPNVAMMNHSCVSNTCHSVSPSDYRVRLRTTVKVPANGELYGSYTHSLLPTMMRREHLLEGKHFACACPRCSDPTELGTHMSSLKCHKCDNGVVMSLDSLDSESTWKCTHCEFSTNGAAVRKMLQIIQAELDAVEAISGADGADAIQARETFMKKYRSVLHPRHAFLTMIRHSLSQMYGRVDEYLLDDLPVVVLEHKVDICHLLLQVLDVVEPGYSRIRGMTLYELHAPLLFLAKDQWNAGVIDEAGLKSKMTEAARVLKEAATILCLEPPDTPEGQIGVVAKESLTQLQQSMNELSRTRPVTQSIFGDERKRSQSRPVSRMPSSESRIEERCQSNVVSTSKYKVARSERLGRFMVAARNVAAGEVILREKPVSVGPTAFSTDYLCFACLRSLPKVNNDAKRRCAKCGVAPLCGTVCQGNLGHHTPDECELFARNRDVLADHVTQITVLLLPLRLWLLKKRNPSLWERVDCMEDHMEKRRDTPVWKDRQINVVETILTLGLIPDDETYDAEFLHRVCSILDVNSFELRSPDNLDGLLLRGLYTEAALMAHDCRGNTHLTVDNDFQLTVYASQPINEGEFILFNYTSSLLGTAERREHLREGKYFECDCSLCSDPFEMETHLSTILCPRCKQGFVGIQDPLVINPYNKNARWQCEACRKTFGGGLMKATLDITRKHINESDETDIKQLELLASKLSRTFHPNHSLMLALKQKLLAAYRKEVASLNPPRKIIQRMLELCKEVFQVLEIVQPGISRLKGIMLYEMHLPMVLLANRMYSAREISTSELAARLEEAGSLLKKALTMLLLEPAATPEGRLAKRALQEMKVLNLNIADVKALPDENDQKSRVRKTKEGRKKKN